jgi:aminopeptidase-like protein
MNSIMRSKYHEYPEYHTSLDNLDFISDMSLRESVAMYQQCVLALEGNCVPLAKTVGEPQLGKRGLYPTTGGQVQQSDVSDIVDLHALSDGQSDLLDIATRMGRPISELVRIVELLRQHQLLTVKRSK